MNLNIGNESKRILAAIVWLSGFALFIPFSHGATLELDQDFRPPVFADPNPCSRTLLLADGKYLMFFGTDTLTDQRTGAITRYLPDGTLDTSFSFSRDYKVVSAAAATPNGQLIISAIQYVYNGGSGAERILRLNVDGSIDSTFNSTLVHPEGYQTVRVIAVQPDGKILVGGSFDTFGGVAHQLVVRLLPDGTPDPTFTSPQFGGWYYGIYSTPFVLGNGKILVAGDFDTVNGIPYPSVAQLNSDGSVDSGFQPPIFTRYAAIRGLAVQSDGKILLAGHFRLPPPSTTRPPVIRLNADGSVDQTYADNQFFTSDTARDLKLQPDGKAVAVVSSSVYRLEDTGILDATFTPPTFIDTSFDPIGYTGFPTMVNIQPDGRMLVAGVFCDVNPPGAAGRSHFGLVRLNSDGSVDSGLVTDHRTGFEDYSSGFARLPDGSALVTFPVYSSLTHDPQMPFDFGRLLPDGSVDPDFTLSSADPGGILADGFISTDFIRLLDGDFLVTGYFATTVGKFHPNGAQDLAFQLPIDTPYFQKAATVPNGKILLMAGSDPQATVFAPVTQIRRDGSHDFSFNLPSEIFTNQVIRDGSGYLLRLYVGSHVLAVQPNGQILYLYFSSDELFHFVRLNGDGSVDNSFSEQTIEPYDLRVDSPYVWDPVQVQLVQPFEGAYSATAPFQKAHIQSDGRILLCGPFTSYKGVPARGVIRLLPDGAIDNTFNIGGGSQWTQTTETTTFFPYVETMEEQVDGKLLIVGTFEAFNGTKLPGIASLNSDGSLDSSFVPPARRQRFARGTTRMARQPDGSFLLSGPYCFPNENDPSFIRIDSIGNTPVVGSAPTATGVVGQPFAYQIEASGQPTSFNASGLPSGFTINTKTGVITATPTAAHIGIHSIQITATNQEGTSPIFHLTLSVIPAQVGPLPGLQNISTRLRVLAGDNALIGGFIITGSGPRTVIIRGIGPSLIDVGISDALADTVLELHGPGTFVTRTNDNWRDTQEAEIQATGIPPTNDLESAIVATLDPGAYTAIVRGKNDGTGVGLVEAYDLYSGSTAESQFLNISTRGFVDVGQNVMIGGIIAGPSDAGSGRVLVRAIGPSLSAVGVPNALQDPILELHNSSGSVIASNDNWRETQEHAIEATGIPPTNDYEAAIFYVLSPGSYTAVVRGADNGIGVGLVEVYNLE